MSERIKWVLISLWLFLSYPFNLATLKHLIRDAFRLTTHLEAGLGKHLWLQYLMAFIVVAWVIVLLLRKNKLGRTLAVVLLAASCCEMAGLLLIQIPYAFWGHAGVPAPPGFVLVAVIIMINLACLRGLGVRNRPAPNETSKP